MAQTASFDSFIREEDNLIQYGNKTPRGEPNSGNKKAYVDQLNGKM